MKQIKFGILADRFLSWRAGIIYLENLLVAAQTQRELPTTVFVSTQHRRLLKIPENVQTVTYQRPNTFTGVIGALHGVVTQGDRIPLSPVMSKKPDVLFGHGLATWMPGVRTIANVLDYRDASYPGIVDDQTRLQRQAQERNVRRLADGLVFNSNYSLQEYQKRHPSSRQEVAVIPLLASFSRDDLALSPQRVATKYSLPESFFLVPSQIWEHKNHMMLLEALAIAKQELTTPPTAVLTGAPHDPRATDYLSRLLQRISSLDLRKEVIILGELSRQEQVALMRRSAFLVQPSLHEGAGLPAEEARYLGKPIIMADLPIQREADIPRAQYFSCTSSSLAAAIARLVREIPPNSGESIPESENKERLAKAGEALVQLSHRVVARKKG